MFTMENLPIILLIVIVLWKIRVIAGSVMVLTQAFRWPVFNPVQREDIEASVEQTIKPLEAFLLSKGFEYKYVLVYDSIQIGVELKRYTYYYYHEKYGVHASIGTTPDKGSLEGAVITYETFYESKHICMSTNGMGHVFAVVPENIYLYDHYHDTLEAAFLSHLKDREIEGESIVRHSLSQEGLIDYNDYIHHLFIEAYHQKGVVRYTQKGYRFRVSLPFFTYVSRFIKGYDKYAKVLKNKASSQSVESSDKESQIQSLSTQLDATEKPRTQQNKLVLFSLSVIAFVVVFGIFGISLPQLAMIVLILFVHEAGHLLAMRFFGYKDTSIFFIPFFGAATVGKKERTRAWEEFIVYLAGPLPGIVLGIGILVYLGWNGGISHVMGDSYLGSYAMMSIVINYINLLPIFPLDGGKIVQVLLLLRYPRIQFYFYVVSLGVVILSIFWLQNPFLILFAVVLGIALKQNYHISTLLHQLILENKDEEADKSKLLHILSTDAKYQKETLASKTQIAQQALKVLRNSKPTKMLSIFGMLFYLLLVSPPIAATMYIQYQMDSGYAALPKEAKEQLSRFHSEVSHHKGLTKADPETYTMKESMEMIDAYLQSSEINRTIEKAQDINESVAENCNIPGELKDIYRWHGSITRLLPYESLLNDKAIRETYMEIREENKDFDDAVHRKYVPVIVDEETYGLAYHCEKEGLYDYSRYEYDSTQRKEYYDFNHFLKVTSEAYRQHAYVEDYDGLHINERKLAKIKREYLSQADKVRYQKFLAYLQDKARKFHDASYSYLKVSLLREMGDTYDEELVNEIR